MANYQLVNRKSQRLISGILTLEMQLPARNKYRKYFSIACGLILPEGYLMYLCRSMFYILSLKWQSIFHFSFSINSSSLKGWNIYYNTNELLRCERIAYQTSHERNMLKESANLY